MCNLPPGIYSCRRLCCRSRSSSAQSSRCSRTRRRCTSSRRLQVARVRGARKEGVRVRATLRAAWRPRRHGRLRRSRCEIVGVTSVGEKTWQRTAVGQIIVVERVFIGAARHDKQARAVVLVVHVLVCPRSAFVRAHVRPTAQWLVPAHSALATQVRRPCDLTSIRKRVGAAGVGLDTVLVHVGERIVVYRRFNETAQSGQLAPTDRVQITGAEVDRQAVRSGSVIPLLRSDG
eukprot:6686909-Prymnesium_polylepis.1